MNNQDFQRLLVTDDKALVNELTRKRKAGGEGGGSKKERPFKGKGKGKDGEGKGKGKGKKAGKGEGKLGTTPSGGQAPAGPQYRDRAKERREQKGEYEMVAEEFEKHGEVTVDQSKHLGGDLEHTHLVKGLDFALLNKVRTELTKQQKVQEVQEQRSQKKAAQKKRTFETQLGKRVWHSVVETLHPHHSSFRKRLQGMTEALAGGQRIRGAPTTFLPGRMYYEFDLGESKGGNDIPRTIYTSKDDAPVVDRSRWVAAVLPQTLLKVAEAFNRVAEERKQRRRDRKAIAVNGEQPAYARAQQVSSICRHKAKDLDEDIFADAGGFSALEVARSVKASMSRAPSTARSEASAKTSDTATSAPKRPSYFADAGAEKYRKAPEGQLELNEVENEDKAGDPDEPPREVAFEAAERFLGPRLGWAFKLGPKGLGYYQEASKPATSSGQKKKKQKGAAAEPAAEDDAYGECFPESGLGHAGVGTGENNSDEEGDDVKSKIERLKKLAGKKGDQGPDSVAANTKGGGEGKKKKLSDAQQWQKIEHMIKKGKVTSVEALEASMNRGRKAPPAPREIMSTPAYF